MKYSALFSLAMLVTLSACGGKTDPLKAARPKTVPASGKVTYNGTPVEGAQVNLIPATNTDPAAFALTEADGTFTLTTYDDGDGAVPGNYQVTVVKRSVETILNPDDPNGPPVGSKEESFLPKKYGSVSSTDLQANISSEGTDSLEFSLTD
ncbi:carboxypeptidase-like regulatory domain-containing protein [Thalassoglobus polymorphus]|uniref:Carboxypeptidase regulatory-like domain-containing protein n=1 Tax=Thalassoglobus polymorphus TaxID=2527994 RepID=A0A517QRC8_9PLAN|nr:carboxypeptidase-like regulatory domain-containing protein [Thalassoglobus polymorphus]QDT34155.1 hypothetical protein Mal48_34150 [Thalassoglobus polymorphus]